MAHQFYSFSDFYALRKKHPYMCLYHKFTSKNSDIISAYQNKLSSGVKVKAEEIASQLFPCGDKDIFISHRSRDSDYAHAVQREIMITTGLSCFIDSDVWQDMYQIVETHQQELVLKGATLRDVNRLVSQFTLLLQGALLRMVENCPIFLFVAPQELLQSAKNGCIETDSPWINLELQFAKKIYQGQQMQKRAARSDRSERPETMSFMIYQPPTEFLSSLSLSDLSTLSI